MVARRIPAGRSQDFEPWSLPAVARGQVLKAENVRARKRVSPAEPPPAAPRQSFEQQLAENIRAGRFATGVSASQLEAIVRDAAREGRADGYAEGFARGEEEGRAQGLEEGLAAGRAIIEDQAARLGALVAALQQPIAGQQQELREAMLAMVTRIARAVVRAELRLQPESIRAVVGESLAALPLGSSAVRVMVAPADAALLEGLEGHGRDWRVEPDPALRPGDCRVEAEQSVIEYSVSSRFDELLGQLLGPVEGTP